MSLQNLSPNFLSQVADDVQRALAEDVGSGDLTASLIDPARMATATIICRENAVICGQPWVNEILRRVVPTAQVTWHYSDGQRCQPGDKIVQAHGPARELLTAERVCLNFLQTQRRGHQNSNLCGRGQGHERRDS
jgi:nicotinate-nucleotide pyrophosphorylase (carboxylating)